MDTGHTKGLDMEAGQIQGLGANQALLYGNWMDTFVRLLFNLALPTQLYL